MSTFENPRVAVGGLGGSGTRVFAATLMAAGIDMGGRLNTSLDNLWFTLLFKRSVWTRERPDSDTVTEAADLFFRATTSGLRDNLRPQERALLAQLRADLPPSGPWKCGANAEDADSLTDSGPRPGDSSRPWGWKEPNTHLFLPQLAARFPGLRYIHVVRDGLDMAFSKNTWQARHWSHLYGLDRSPDTPLPLHQLRYWTAANRAALDFGAARMPGRFLAVSYEDYCRRPDWHWPRLRDFLGLPAATALPDDLLHPTSIGRSQDRDLSLFPADVLSAARALQAEVDALGTPR
ncbi:sulfotransferase [Fertoebacter nigrum]|uniref:Sulfotransferase n=1 Tax=Fertoeibacter niger TaxID=2656921 RepID=A0A8X8KPW6_9RHOB|nr:sulfotransferase [Fertoeibacter niger]NUB46535.1 sulfotransferase [Fertoeibacter niger]